MNSVYFGLGSNIGDRRSYLIQAIRGLANFTSIKNMSSIYECPAMMPDGAPESWNQQFLNMVLHAKTDTPVNTIIECIEAIETNIGRTRAGHWGPREIDIDLLLYDDLIVQSDRLNIPHRGIIERDFVLLPLAEIAPDLRYPVEGEFYKKPYHEILALRGFSEGSACRIIGTIKREEL